MKTIFAFLSLILFVCISAVAGEKTQLPSGTKETFILKVANSQLYPVATQSGKLSVIHVIARNGETYCCLIDKPLEKPLKKGQKILAAHAKVKISGGYTERLVFVEKVSVFNSLFGAPPLKAFYTEWNVAEWPPE